MGLHSSGLTCFTEALSLLLSSTQRLLLILLQSHEDEGEQRLLASLLINTLLGTSPWPLPHHLTKTKKTANRK